MQTQVTAESAARGAGTAYPGRRSAERVGGGHKHATSNSANQRQKAASRRSSAGGAATATFEALALKFLTLSN